MQPDSPQVPISSQKWINVMYGVWGEIVVHIAKVVLSILLAIGIDIENNFLINLCGILFVLLCFLYFLMSSWLIYFIYLDKNTIWLYDDSHVLSIFSIYFVRDNYSYKEAKLIFTEAIVTAIAFFILFFDLFFDFVFKSKILSLFVAVCVMFAIIIELICWYNRFRLRIESNKSKMLSYYHLLFIIFICSIFSFYILNKWYGSGSAILGLYLFRIPFVVLFVCWDFLTCISLITGTSGNLCDQIIGVLICICYIPTLILWVLYEAGDNNVDLVCFVLIPTWTVWLLLCFCCPIKYDKCCLEKHAVNGILGDYDGSCVIVSNMYNTGDENDELTSLIDELNQELSNKRDCELFESTRTDNCNHNDGGDDDIELTRKKVSLKKRMMENSDYTFWQPLNREEEAEEENANVTIKTYNYRLRSKNLIQEIISPNHVALNPETYRYYAGEFGYVNVVGSLLNIHIIITHM